MDNKANHNPMNQNNIKNVKKHNDKNVLISMISGLFSGSMAKLFTHPIDTLKARVQVEIKGKEKILHCMKNVLEKEGIPGLYRGLGISIFGSIHGYILYFGFYEFAKNRLQFVNYFQRSEFLKFFISGFFAETIACLIFVPVDIVKQRRQVQSKLKICEYKTDLDALNKIIKTEKIRGIYKGYGATLMSYAPMSGFYFMFYEHFKNFLVRIEAKTTKNKIIKESKIGLTNDNKDRLKFSFSKSLLCSSLASSLACFMTTPLDLVKLRIQVQKTSDGSDLKLTEYRNMIQGLISIGYTEGVKGLYRGSIARILSFTPTVALTMTFIELSKPKVEMLLDGKL